MFSVLSGHPANSHTLALDFSIPPDFGVSATSDPVSYTVTGPGTPVVRLVRLVEGQVHLLLRDPLQEGSYNVLVGPSVEAVGGHLPDPSQDEVSINGIPYLVDVRYLTSVTLQVTFGKAIIQNLALTTISNYTVVGPQGPVTPVSVTSVGVDQVTLRFSTSLVRGQYKVAVKGLTTTESLPFYGSVVSQVQPSRKRISVSLSQFTGEVKGSKPTGIGNQERYSLQESVSVVVDRYRASDREPIPGLMIQETLQLQDGLTVTGGWHMVGMSLQQGGTEHSVSVSDLVATRARVYPTTQPVNESVFQVSLSESYSLKEDLTLSPDRGRHPLTEAQRNLFGSPDGLVFFSPSLANVANSTIQVDDVKACTKAYDTYAFPEQEDVKKPLYTYGPRSALSLIGSDVLLRGSRTRVGGALFELHSVERDTLDATEDTDASFLLSETYPPARASLLSNPGWATFTTGILPPKYLFKTVDNSSPMPAPVVGSGVYFANPSFVWNLLESLTLEHTMSVDVGESLTQAEGYDLSPGENVVQANVSETLTLTEAPIAPVVGVNLSHTFVLTESLVLA